MRLLYKGQFNPEEVYVPGSVVRMPDGYKVYTYRGDWTDVEAPPDMSCRGPAGRDGIDGRNGRDGRDGVDGRDGRDGKDGAPGKRGPRGKSGESTSYTQVIRRNGEATAVAATFDTPAARGQAVRISSDGHVDLALATGNDASALVVGLATGDGHYVTHGPFTSDWNLTPGTYYYLSPTEPGGITDGYPTGIGEYVVMVGIAATPKTLLLNIDYGEYVTS
ncbi:MAG TPA: hypothetical protein PKC18_16315 [Lacipirellulaceae bacterium]|nr:hypothetical protein [Lacipirellulaceae bacterium]